MFKMGGCCRMMIWIKSYEALLDRNSQTGSTSYSAVYCRRQSNCGRTVGLDRNGLRPARYIITQDGFITLASEVGIWDYTADEVVEKGRVGPGELLVIDTKLGKIWHSDEIDQDLKSRHPYKSSCKN